MFTHARVRTACSRAPAPPTSRSSSAIAAARCSGRAFKDADILAGRFERGELVRVRGRVEKFRDELQVDVQQIERAESADPAEFLPVAYRDMEELDGFLEHLAREVHDPAYAGLLERLIGDDALRAAWRRAPCTRNGHHAYLGGLLEHTVAVGQLAVETAALHVRLNSDLLLCAALVHDLGKTREFTYGAEIGLSEEGRLLGHVVLGQRHARRADGRDGRGQAARARPLRALPPRAGRGAGAALRLPRGARALPDQRARCFDQGRIGTRAQPQGLRSAEVSTTQYSPQLRPLSVGEVLDASFKIVRQSFGTLAGCVLVVALPLNIINTLITASTRTTRSTSTQHDHGHGLRHRHRGRRDRW